MGARHVGTTTGSLWKNLQTINISCLQEKAVSFSEQAWYATYLIPIVIRTYNSCLLVTGLKIHKRFYNRSIEMELQCKIQNYDWGKLGHESTVAKLLKSANPSVSIDNNTPYAELWMGTHPNGPSLIIERDILLSEYIKDNVDAIGPAVRQRFGVAVPFLLKVLSVRKALSIQAHPKKVRTLPINILHLE